MKEEMTKRTIGVEIEFTGITRNKASKILSKYFNSEAYHYGQYYDEYHIRDDENRKWKLMFDGSIKPQKEETYEFLDENTHSGKIRMCELVTPILTYKDVETLIGLVTELSKAGAITNFSAGIHIHVGAENFTVEKLKNLVNLMTSKEDLIYSALEVGEWRKKYCKKTNKEFLNRLNSNNPKTVEELSKIWYNSDHPEWNMEHHYDHSRYTHTNLHAYFTKGTIEFRLFNSTLNPILIKSYIQFVLAVVEKVLTGSKAVKYKQSIIENGKYQMRSWLRQLGLNGEEYRDCRHTFLNKLEGDLANKSIA